MSELCNRPLRTREATLAQVPLGSPTRWAMTLHVSPWAFRRTIADTFSGVARTGRPGGRPLRVRRRPSLISRIATRTRSDRRFDSKLAMTGSSASSTSLPRFGLPSSGVSNIGSLSE